jgi:hypothetical protein
MDAMGLADVPMSPLLTLEEAARVLRIGRSLSYQLAGEYLASGGLSGLPVIRIGGCLRLPRWALIELALTGRVVRLCDVDIESALVGAMADD